jgi:hypothetical protein
MKILTGPTRNFFATHASFQERIVRIAGVADKTAEEVFAMWCQYCERCHDQSALVSEFVDWYRKELGGNVGALHTAAR